MWGGAGGQEHRYVEGGSTGMCVGGEGQFHKYEVWRGGRSTGMRAEVEGPGPQGIWTTSKVGGAGGGRPPPSYLWSWSPPLPPAWSFDWQHFVAEPGFISHAPGPQRGRHFVANLVLLQMPHCK